MTNQAQLLLKDAKKRDVSDEVVMKARSFKEALRLCKDVSGLTDLQLAQELEIDPSHWSRIWLSKANFPEEKIEKFMELCENIIPLRWLALRYGFELRPILSIVEIENIELKSENEQLRRDMATITNFLRNAGLSVRTGSQS